MTRDSSPFISSLVRRELHHEIRWMRRLVAIQAALLVAQAVIIAFLVFR